jgi:hypothetical protein
MCRMNKATSGLPALLLIGMAACVDLNVANPNDADRGRVIRNAGDVESLIAGAYSAWVAVLESDGPSPFLSNASGEHVAPWGNFGMEMYARIPRIPTSNGPGAANVGNLTDAWFQAYGAIAAIRDGLTVLADSGDEFLGTQATLRARAYGKFMQGLAHATIAVLYDSAFVYDERVVIPTGVNPLTIVQLKGAREVWDSASSFFAQAIALARSDTTFTIPALWMSQTVSSVMLKRLAYSERARFRVAMARTPAERAAVDWAAVRQDVDSGITADWNNVSNCSLNTFCDDALQYRLAPGWQMQNNWVAGMADTSGAYQAWVAAPLASKQPFLIKTPDTRWPQGADETAQLANPGEFYSVNNIDVDGSRIWERPDRGTWRWSYYYQTYEPFYTTHGIDGEGATPLIRAYDLRALVAEADFRAGNLGAVATFVNSTRTTHGLNATDAAGTNTSCVPRLPNGTCGNLWEMFKWEKRLETQFAGPLRSGWWLDGRGWGDLMRGTIVQFPVPYRDILLLGREPYNYGGVGGVFGAPVGTYGY